MGASFRDIQNFVAQAKDAGFKFRSKDLLEERDRLKDMPLTEMAEQFGAEQVFWNTRISRASNRFRYV